MVDDVVEIEYQLTVDDYVNFFVNVCCKKPVRPKLFFLLVRQIKGLTVGMLSGFTAIFLVIFIGSSYDVFEAADIFLQTLFSPALVVMVTLCFPIFLCIDYFALSMPSKKLLRGHYQSTLNSEKNYSLTLPQRLHFTNDGVSIFTQFFEAKYRWPSFVEIEQIEGSLYIFTSSVSAIIIPRRAFESDAAFDTFYDKCLSYYNAAKIESERAGLV